MSATSIDNAAARLHLPTSTFIILVDCLAIIFCVSILLGLIWLYYRLPKHPPPSVIELGQSTTTLVDGRACSPNTLYTLSPTLGCKDQVPDKPTSTHSHTTISQPRGFIATLKQKASDGILRVRSRLCIVDLERGSSSPKNTMHDDKECIVISSPSSLKRSTTTTTFLMATSSSFSSTASVGGDHVFTTAPRVETSPTFIIPPAPALLAHSPFQELNRMMMRDSIIANIETNETIRHTVDLRVNQALINAIEEGLDDQATEKKVVESVSRVVSMELASSMAAVGLEERDMALGMGYVVVTPSELLVDGQHLNGKTKIVGSAKAESRARREARISMAQAMASTEMLKLGSSHGRNPSTPRLISSPCWEEDIKAMERNLKAEQRYSTVRNWV